MKLRDYLASQDISVEAFAEKVGRSKWGVRKWVYGQRTPRQVDLAKIAKLTEGRVNPNDFMIDAGAA